MALSAIQVAQAAYSGGWKSVGDIATATAIAKAESGWNPRAHNPKPPDNSYGLWQINMLGAMGPARRKQFGISSNEQLFDPATNARAAFMVWKSQGWRAWSVYKNGAYRKHLTEATAAAQKVVLSGGNVPGGGITADPNAPVGTPVSLGSGIKAIEVVVDFVKMATNPKNWLRMAAFVSGAWLLLLGMAQLAGFGKVLKGATKAGFNAVIGSKTGGLVKV